MLTKIQGDNYKNICNKYSNETNKQTTNPFRITILEKYFGGNLKTQWIKKSSDRKSVCVCTSVVENEKERMCVWIEKERSKKNQCFGNEEGIKKKPICFRVSECVCIKRQRRIKWKEKTKRRWKMCCGKNVTLTTENDVVRPTARLSVRPSFRLKTAASKRI